MAPLVIAGFVRLWRTPELRFIAVTAALIVVYVLAWIPGKVYYTDGVAPAVLAAGALAADLWIARARRPRLRRGLVLVAALVGVADVLGGQHHLPPVLFGHNAYWMWGPGRASDRTVLVVDALGQLKLYFASCRRLEEPAGQGVTMGNW